MKRIKNIFYAIVLAFLFCNPICAQNNVKITKVGKLIQESLPSTWVRDTFMTYYIAADAEKTERFIKEGDWKDLRDKIYVPYTKKTGWKIQKYLKKVLSKVLTKKQKKLLNPIGEERNIFTSDFYIFVNSKQRFVKIGMRSSTAKYLTQEQIYKILLLYSKCKLPVHPVVGAFKEKEYYITGASVDNIK
nr:hypothetical protein [uncultured Prevotella sp.]